MSDWVAHPSKTSGEKHHWFGDDDNGIGTALVSAFTSRL